MASRRSRPTGLLAGEKALTSALRTFFASDTPDWLVGVGDDCAVVRPRGDAIVLKTDPVVVGVHCAPGTPARLIARKAVHRNFSDLAAIGAAPDWVLATVLLPKGYPKRARRELFVGLRAAATAAGAVVVGGHTGGTPGPLTLSITVIGHLVGRPLLRSAARAGDAIHVTGALGGSGRGKHLRFRPRLAEGAWLARQRQTGAVIDVSDGLLIDLATVLARSGGLGAELFADSLPIARAATGLAAALTEGEDYELLFTWRPGPAPRGKGILPVTARRPIGRVVAEPGIHLVTADGRRQRLAVRGFEHAL